MYHTHSIVPSALPASAIKLWLVIGNKKGAGETFCHLSRCIGLRIAPHLDKQLSRPTPLRIIDNV